MRRITAMKVLLACTVSLALLAGPSAAVGAQDEGRSCPQGWVADQSRCETFVVHDPNGMPVQPAVIADTRGRISFDVDLGPPHTHQQYTVPQRALEATGDYWQTHTVTFTPGVA